MQPARHHEREPVEAPLDAATVEAWILRRVAECAGLRADEVEPEAVLADLGLSSRDTLVLVGELQELLGRPIAATTFWQYPTARQLARHLTGTGAVPAAEAAPPDDRDRRDGEPIAVIGVGCRFPGATTPAAFWELLDAGRDAVGADVPGHPPLGRPHGLLPDVDRFDAEFFGISGQEAVHVDPQQRLLLEVAWETLEQAGIPATALAGSRTGVFVGISASDYGRLIAGAPPLHSRHTGIGQALSIAANRISYTLDLRGPSLAVDTACSSSLVAVHLACRSLRLGEADLALAGGVNLILATDATAIFEQAGMMAADGRCKTFDAAADGYVRAEGCGLVLLKPLGAALRDGDQVLAVIRGSAVSQDGRSNGLTAPRGGAQEAVLREALRDAGLRPTDIDYVEAHGTGTPLGDPIEAAALVSVLGEGRGPGEPFAVGSVKTNIGHAEAAAGIAGLLKVVLMLQHQRIPAHLHLRERNPGIPGDAPLVIPTAAQQWRPRNGTLTAGVSSFGFGGTNAHVILQAAPPQQSGGGGGSIRPAHLFTVSGKTPTAVAALAARYAALLDQPAAPALADVCSSIHTGRSHFRHRVAFAARNREEAVAHLRRVAAGASHPAVHTGLRPAGGPGPVAFLFSGQGAQYVDMGRQLYVTDTRFRSILDGCEEIARELLGRGLRSVLFPQADERHLLHQTRYTQPALFCVEYALAQLWMHWGVRPDHLLGHSVGEFAAACVAGVFDLADGIRLVAERGRLVQELSAPGAMLVAFTDEETVRSAVAASGPDHTLSVAAVNAPASVTVAGDPDTIAWIQRYLTDHGVTVRAIRSGFAFHSPMMAAARAAFAEVASGIRYRLPDIPLVSDLDGRHFDAGYRPDASYWARHLEATVRFADGVRCLGDAGCTTFIEVGPGQVLLGAGRRVVSGARWLPSLRDGVADWAVLTDSLARLYAAGHDLDWAGLHHGYRRRRVQLPTYPFERRRYWLPPVAGQAPTSAGISNQRKAEEHVEPASPTGTEDQILADLGQIVATLLEIGSPIDPDMSFLELGADSMTLFQTIQTVQRAFGVTIPIGLLFEEVNTLRRLAAYIQRTAPADVLARRGQAGPAAAGQAGPLPVHTVPPAGPDSAGPLPAGAEPAPLAAADGGAIDRFLDVHAQIMDQAYDLLRRRQAHPVDEVGQVRAADSAPAAGAAGSGVGPGSAARAATGSAPVAPGPGPATPAQRHRTPVPVAAAGTFVAFEPRPGGTSRALTEMQRAFIAEVVRSFCARTAGSRAQAMAERRRHADVRHAPQPYLNLKETRYPIVVARSRGARVWDVDGNEYIDLTMGFGVNLFGHNEPFINEAIAAQLAEGMQLGPHSPLVPEVTELITELTGKERVVYCNTGSEAVMVAVRLARAVTGRHQIALFAGAYHGSADPILARQNPEGTSGDSVPMAPGVPPEVAANALVLPYGDPASLEVLRERAGELAAVLVEPVQSRRPDIQPVDFLRELRQITADAGTPLVFDEVITGFRMHPAGVQGMFGITADITTYGKVVGGGLPIGVVAGDARYLDAIDGGAWEFGDQPYPRSVRTFFSGTFCKHPLALAASRAVLRELRRRGGGLQEELNARVAALGERLDAMFEAADVPIRVARFGSLFRLRLLDEPAQSERVEIFHTILVHNGLYIWEGRNCFLSTAHTDADVDQIVTTVARAADAMTAVGLFPGARSMLAGANGHRAGAR